MSEDRNHRALRNFYDFNDDDLEANRQGRLSQKQLDIINSVSKERRMLAYGIGAFALVIGIIILAVVLFAVLLLWATHDWNKGAVSGISAGVIGSLALFGVAAFFMRLLLKKANARYTLRTTRGGVHLTKVNVRARTRSYQQHQMQIGDALFVLDDELVGHIKEGEIYAVYYLDYQDGSEGIIQSLEKA